MIGRLHVITDETLQTRYSHVELAAMAAEGGADTVQLREKRTREEQELARVAREILGRFDGLPVRLIVDDRVELARSVGAAGVHLGPHDEDPVVARRLLGAGATIGGTANDPQRARVVDALPVDYIGVGPVFGTRSKQNPAPALGLGGLKQIVELVERPVIAIGGITPETVESVLATGAYGVAVLSAVVCSEDPATEVARLAAAVARAVQTGVA